MPIMARITIDGKLAQFNTKLEVNPKNWQAKTGKVSGNAGWYQSYPALTLKESFSWIYPHELPCGGQQSSGNKRGVRRGLLPACP